MSKNNSIIDDQKIELKDDIYLLDLMLADSKGQNLLYLPGPYWANKSRNIRNEIKRCGIVDFRGSRNFIGRSYADNFYIDIRNSYNYGMRRLFRLLTQIYPFSKIFESQIELTESYVHTNINYVQQILNLKRRVKDLLEKYKLPYSLLGNCLSKVMIDGKEYSIRYIELLDQHDHIASWIDFKKAHSVFEIGGGFGVNAHLLLENYNNIRKILYLDIPPNLYVGTQYLKALYGDAVRDYRLTKNLEVIKFSEDDSLEILCIAPWQIEKFRSAIDIFYSARCFVEMPIAVVQNYVDKFNGFPHAKEAGVGLVAYEAFDSSKEFHANELPKIFSNRQFDCFEAEEILESPKKNFYFVSPGKFSF